MLSPELLFYSMLDEKQKRLYAGLKALMLGYHGVSQVAAELAIHAHTVRLGQKELSSSTLLAPAKVRKAGGGRKKKIESEPKISAFFDDLVKDNTAGSPMDGRIRWTDISLSGFVKLYDQLGIKLTRFIIKQLLKQQGYVKRKMSKNGIIKEVAHRDEQFEYIAAKKKEFIAKNLPVLSIDTKKKEFIGKLYRQGACYCTEAEVVYDHDFPSLADGVLIPHGIFDVVQNRGYMTIGTSKDTSEFLVDNIKHHWLNNIQQNYENADQMLLLMDGGGSNSCLHYIVKEDLQKLVNELQISITIAHYPRAVKFSISSIILDNLLLRSFVQLLLIYQFLLAN